MGNTFLFYVRLAPGGRELDDGERRRADELLGAGAASLRVVDEQRELITRLALEGQRSGTDTDLRPTASLLRSLQRSLVLALSDDSDLRKLAMTVDEVKARAEPIYDTWNGLFGA
jgi:hypothetical protein